MMSSAGRGIAGVIISDAGSPDTTHLRNDAARGARGGTDCFPALSSGRPGARGERERVQVDRQPRERAPASTDHGVILSASVARVWRIKRSSE